MALRDPVAVYNAASNLEAHVLRDAMIDEGIEAFITEDVSQVGVWAMGLLPEIHKPQVWVERAEIERAVAVLNRYEQRRNELQGKVGHGDTPSSQEIEVVCEECGARLNFSAAQEGSVQQCSECGEFVDVEQREPAQVSDIDAANPYRSPRGILSREPRAAISVPSRTLFRSVVALTVLFWFVSLLPSFGVISLPTDVQRAHEWNYHGAMLSYEVVDAWWWISTFAKLAAMIGMMAFWNPARWILLITTVANLLISPLMGTSVASAFEHAAGGTYYVGVIWLLTVSFCSPLAEEFVGGRRSIA